MEVSTHFPFSTALMEAPFPRWAHDDLGIVKIQSQELGRMFGYEAVACPVESVAAYRVFLIVFIGKAVEISLLRHGLMESGIEYSYHRCRPASASGRH